MKTFVALVNWTQKGIQEVTESSSRIEKARAAIAAAGGEMKAFFVTLGRFDMVAVIEVPDEMTYAKVMLALGSRGGVRTETMSAFSVDEFAKIVEALP